MTPLFWIDKPGDIPVPCLDEAPDGTPREPDHLRYFDLESAAAQSGLAVSALQRQFENYLREQMAIADAPTPAPTPTPPDPGKLNVVPAAEFEDGSPLDALFHESEKIDLAALNAETVKNRIRQRMAGITGEHYVEFENQMRELGYDILRRECYPVVQWNADLKKYEVFCCATLDVVERKVLASGVCDGWVGPTLYAGPDGELKPIWLSEEPPTLCQVMLRRKGFAEPCIVLLDWCEAAQYLVDASGKKRTRTLTQFWRERPKLAMEKCAKMKAMRTMFRDFVGAVYVREELPELSARALRALPTEVDRSTTAAGIRNSRFPRLSSSHRMESDGESSSLVLETITNEADARAIMQSRGLVQPFMIDKVIAKAREERGEVEDMDPEAFWNYVLEQAARRFGMRMK